MLQVEKGQWKIPIPENRPCYPLTSDHFISPLEPQVKDFLSEVVRVGYSPTSTSIISYSTRLANAHELNEVVKKRKRKFDGGPYMEHPLEMAQEAARMRLHPTIVAACLVHDIPEDVIFAGIDSPTMWLDFMSEAYDGYEDKDRLLRILRAELKTETLSGKFPDEKERKEVVDHYMDTPMGQTAVTYLRDVRGDPNLIPSDLDKEQISEVIFDLNRIFTESYVETPDGTKEFDPSILTVKILDTWQNLKTPGFWKDQLADEQKDAKTVAKLIRARTLTNVAEFLGMRKVASEMTMSLTAIQDTQDVDRPLLRQLVHDGNGHAKSIYLDRQRELITQLDKAHNSRKFIRQMIDMGSFDNRSPEERFQTPWVAQYPRAIVDTSFGLGNVVYYVPSDPSSPSKPNGDSRPGYLIDEYPLTIQDGALRAALQTLYGRETHDWQIRYDFWPKPYRLRFEDATKPRYTAAMRSDEHSPARSTNVPERNIFHDEVCRYMGPVDGSNCGPDCLRDVVDTKLMGLVNFMFSPHKFVTDTTGESDVPYIIFVNGRMLLANNKTDVALREIALREGISNPVVRSITSSDIHPVTADHHVLDRLRNDGKLNRYNIVELLDKE